MGIRENVISLRVAHGLTQLQLAEIAGVSRGAVSQWEGGFSEPRMGAIQKIADYFNITKARLIEDEPVDDFIEVPLYGSIAAGEPIEMVSFDNRYPVPSKIRERYPNGFLLRVDGESMNRILPNGSYAYIDPSEVVDKPMMPYAVCVNGYNATIKRVRGLNNGFELVPDSNDPTYKSQIFDYGVEGTDEVTVIGRVVWHCIPLDWEY